MSLDFAWTRPWWAVERGQVWGVIRALEDAGHTGAAPMSDAHQDRVAWAWIVAQTTGAPAVSRLTRVCPGVYYGPRYGSHDAGTVLVERDRRHGRNGTWTIRHVDRVKRDGRPIFYSWDSIGNWPTPPDDAPVLARLDSLGEVRRWLGVAKP